MNERRVLLLWLREFYCCTNGTQHIVYLHYYCFIQGNLFAQYRIDHHGNHDYATELRDELNQGKKLSIERYEIDPARGNFLR